MMHQEFVVRYEWLAEEEFLDYRGIVNRDKCEDKAKCVATMDRGKVAQPAPIRLWC